MLFFVFVSIYICLVFLFHLLIIFKDIHHLIFLQISFHFIFNYKYSVKYKDIVNIVKVFLHFSEFLFCFPLIFLDFYLVFIFQKKPSEIQLQGVFALKLGKLRESKFWYIDVDVCLGLCDSEWCSKALRNTFTGERVFVIMSIVCVTH